jgi:hypothetical protein
MHFQRPSNNKKGMDFTRCIWHVYITVLYQLFKFWSTDIKKKIVLDFIQLHVACCSNATLEVIQFLVKQWSKALTNLIGLGSLPLDLAKQTWGENTPNEMNIVIG